MDLGRKKKRMPHMSQSRARKNWVSQTVKDMRDNEPNVLSCDNKLSKSELSYVIYAIISRLNYLYDTATTPERKHEIEAEKAYLMVKLVLLES